MGQNYKEYFGKNCHNCHLKLASVVNKVTPPTPSAVQGKIWVSSHETCQMFHWPGHNVTMVSPPTRRRREK